MNDTKERRDRVAELTELGFKLECGPPHAGVNEDGGKAWPHIGYAVTLFFNDKVVITTEFKLGIGHVDINKYKAHSGAILAARFTHDEEAMHNSMQRNPHTEFKDKHLQARVCVKLAIMQKVKPSLDTVISGLLLDGSPVLNNETFEDWCSNFGMDTDSMKADKMYRLCLETGQKLARSIPPDTLAKAREIVRDL